MGSCSSGLPWPAPLVDRADHLLPIEPIRESAALDVVSAGQADELWPQVRQELHQVRPQSVGRVPVGLGDDPRQLQPRRVGKVACGQCWETVIRQDERTAEAALAASQQENGR